jgi:hypothetical protein
VKHLHEILSAISVLSEGKYNVFRSIDSRYYIQIRVDVTQHRRPVAFSCDGAEYTQCCARIIIAVVVVMQSIATRKTRVRLHGTLMITTHERSCIGPHLVSRCGLDDISCYFPLVILIIIIICFTDKKL